MTDYIPYTVDEYQPDAPATALHFARWFQNWEAGFEGAAGAPRLWGRAAVPDNFILSDGIVADITAAETYNIAGGLGCEMQMPALSTSSISYVMAASFKMVGFRGAARFKISHSRVASGTAYLQLRLNDAIVNTWTTTSQTAIQRVQDVNFSHGDTVSWWHYLTSGGANQSFLSAVEVRASNELYRLGLIAQRVYP